MKVAIVGFATEGQVSYTYFTRQGHDVTICDQNSNIALPAGANAQLGDGYLANLDQFDVIVRSAGIQPEIILGPNPTVANKITTAVDEFLRVCPTKNTIGITGTKGKGTTSTLTTKVLEAAGFRVFLAGNIGNSPLEFIDQLQPDDFVVLELSSFQLSDLKHSPHTAVCLLVVPEHLDWHHDMDNYLLSKAHLFEFQSSSDTAIFYAKNDDSRNIAGYSPALKIPYFAEPGAHIEDGHVAIANKRICHVDELKLLGEHNWQNVCAAVTVCWQFTQNIEAIRKVLMTFSGLPHRIEFVREANGVKYYNDSFATGLHATSAAVRAIPEMQVLIVGGYDRMLPLEEFASFIEEAADHIRCVLVIGASGPRLIEALQAQGVTNFVRSEAKTMEQVITDAQKLAQPGDAIVLSPGFASFDMFKNFEERGNIFRQVVTSL